VHRRQTPHIATERQVAFVVGYAISVSENQTEVLYLPRIILSDNKTMLYA